VLGLAQDATDTVDVGADPQDTAVGTNGPLCSQVMTVRDLTVQVLENCDSQIYQRCVLADSDPNGEFLGVSRDSWACWARMIWSASSAF
jgi:hypothetical protein